MLAMFCAQAEAQTFEQRRQQYIDSALVNFNGNSICIQAFEGVAVDQPTLDTIYDILQTKTTIDFDIVKLIRVLFLGNGAYDAQLVPELNSIPYWINHSDTIRGYWSENHMIMWMSSDWLLHERTGRPADATLEQRLKHYLNLKINYGFYEYFSSTYAPYALSGLLNLADFAQDQEIRDLATIASKRLLKELLMVTNDQGVFYPAAGRNYAGKYMSAHGQNHSNLIWLLTGFGPTPSSASHGGGFLATTSIDLGEVSDSWESELDTTLHLGHSLESGFSIHSGLTDLDRVVFQWSAGAYFHPDVVTETVSLLVDSNMWHHVDFDLLRPLAGFPLESYPGMAEGLSAISKSSVNTHADIAVFKHGPVTLSSNLDFWKGKVGYQQWPVCANSGTSAVYTASGRVEPNWGSRNGNNANGHLPYVGQSHNVALVMYRPEPLNPALPFNDKEVALYWVDSVYDEIVEDGLWLIGREGVGYVAVRRNCTGYIDSVRACPTYGGQTWVIVVGNETMYGSFGNFQDLIEQSQYEETWTVNTDGDSTYYASITFDTIHVDHEWGPLVNTGMENDHLENSMFRVWPNPAYDDLNIDIGHFSARPENYRNPVEMTITDLFGREVLGFSTKNRREQIDVSSYADGMYILTGTVGDGRPFSLKFVKR